MKKKVIFAQILKQKKDFIIKKKLKNNSKNLFKIKKS